MSKNKCRITGDYDMVLGLSVRRINYQFKKMYQHGLLPVELMTLLNFTGGKTDILDPDIKCNVLEWYTLKSKLKEVIEKKDKLEDALDEETLTEEEKTIKQKEYKACKDEKKSLSNEHPEIKKFNTGFDLKLSFPTISFSSKDKNLEFTVNLLKGSKIYTGDIIYEITQDSSFTFNADITSMPANSDDSVVNQDKNGRHKLTKLSAFSGIDSSFTIESLLVDFSNINVSTLIRCTGDLAGSDPYTEQGLSSLTTLFQKYFAKLSPKKDSNSKNKKPNPYIFGYGATKNPSLTSDRALFDPTYLAYSTSYQGMEEINGKEVSKLQNTFNFLMMTGDHSPPKGNDAGVLPESLLCHTIDDKSHAALAISAKIFKKVYGDKILEEIALSLQKTKDTHIEISKFPGEVIIDISSTKFKTSGEYFGCMRLKVLSVFNNQEKKVVTFRLEVSAEMTIHKEINIKMAIVSLGTIGTYWSVSSKGNHLNSKGRVGHLDIDLKAGSDGKLVLTAPKLSQTLSLGFDRKVPSRYSHGHDHETYDFATKIGFLTQSLTEAGESIREPLSKLGSSNEMQNLADLIKLSKLGTLERKIILPVNEVYMYKNVHFYNDAHQADDGVIIFDATYCAPMSD